MISFFDTQYTIRRSRESVFALFSDFPRYLTELPEFHGARLSAEPGPVREGKVYWLDAPGNEYEYRTRVEVVEVESPHRFVYDYQYTARDSHNPLSSREGPMPWDRVRMLLTFDGLSLQLGRKMDLVAGGSSEALVTTQTGLIIAIPSFALAHYVSRRRHDWLYLLRRLESHALRTQAQ